MRRLLAAGLLIAWPTISWADASIAGRWSADLGHKVAIYMDLIADGHWASQTVQNAKVVAEMAGTYEQTKSSDKAGKLVFTPVTSKADPAHGPARVEEDSYTLDQQGSVLRLTTGNETMVFRKQPFAK